MRCLVAVLLFCSCQKHILPKPEAGPLPKDFLARLQSYLCLHLAQDELQKLDFSTCTYSVIGRSCYLQIAFSGRKPTEEFLLVETDATGDCTRGAVVKLHRSPGMPGKFDGTIFLRNIDRKDFVTSNIAGGYIEKLHPHLQSQVAINSSTRPDVIPDPSQLLPEVVVIGYLPGNNTATTWINYMLAQAILDMAGGSPGSSPGGAAGGIYSPVGPAPAALGGSGNNSLLINYETCFAAPAIDVTAFMQCFANIPDPGAQCSITIYTDLPVNNEPKAIFNWYTGATGHAFLQLSKANGNQAATQVLGFAAQKPLQALIGNGPVTCKMVDNGGHKYNGSLTMQLSGVQLKAIIKQIEFISANIFYYSIDRYNCADFVLQVINSIRGTDPLVVPKFQIPGQSFSASNTPEGLYDLLLAMQEAGDPAANEILTEAVLHAPLSKGPCK